VEAFAIICDQDSVDAIRWQRLYISDEPVSCPNSLRAGSDPSWLELLGAREVVHIPKRPGEPDCTFADITAITRDLGWRPKVPIEAGVARLLENLGAWRDAPVWTPEAIAGATEGWFRYLGRGG
jgi:hypothetical protein